MGVGYRHPLLAAMFWGTFEAPRAGIKLSTPVHLVLALAFFALAVASLYNSGQPGLAQALGLVFVINQILLLVWKQ